MECNKEARESCLKETTEKEFNGLPFVISKFVLTDGSFLFSDNIGNVTHELTKLNMDMSANFFQSQTGPSFNMEGIIDVGRVEVEHKKLGKLLDISGIAVKLAPSDFINSEFNIKQINLKNPCIFIGVDKEKTLNWFSAIQPVIAVASSADCATSEVKQFKSKPFSINLDRFLISGAQIDFRDDSNSLKFDTRLFPVYLKVEDFFFGGKGGRAFPPG